jgi:surface antigen
MRVRKTLACICLALSLTACQTQPGGGWSTGETLGTLGGAAGGAFLGSRFGGGAGKLATTAIGTLVGAFAGHELGRRMSGTDSSQASTTERQAVANNQSMAWTNPDTGNRGSIEPTRSYRNTTGQLCRDYTHTIFVGTQAETARGTACQQADGSWQLVN